jgi:hypothetical protein
MVREAKQILTYRSKVFAQACQKKRPVAQILKGTMCGGPRELFFKGAINLVHGSANGTMT